MLQRILFYFSFAGVLVSPAPGGLVAVPAATALLAQSQPNAPQTESSDDGIQRQTDGLFYVNADIGSDEARFIVDTGASHVILSHADAKKAIIAPDPNNGSQIITAIGSVDADWVIIKRIVIAGHILENVPAAIPHRDTELSLLGQSALVRFSSVRIEGDQLAFVH